MTTDPPMTAAQWDARYRAEPDLWTEEPNALVARFAAERAPGPALDVGAGDGRNAIWLATESMGRRVGIVVVLLVSGASLLGAGCGGDDEQPSVRATEPIVRTLQTGGHTLLMRHALSDTAISQRELLRSCATQRNLTVAGREQARAIGRAIRSLRIPIGQVRASPLCRTRETARLAFGRATLDRMLVNTGILGTLADDRRRGRALRAVARRPPPAGENTVLVTHSPNILAASGEETVQEGEILVLGRDGRIVGRVAAERWPALADR